MTDKIHLDRGHLHRLYREMLRIRRFEAKCVELYQAQKIRGFLHLYDGEEAVAVGVMDALELRDAVLATYREHGHALARGVPMAPLMAEMLGKLEGCCRGRGCFTASTASSVATPSSAVACRWPWALPWPTNSCDRAR